MNAVVDKHDVLAAVHEVQDGLCGVAERKRTKDHFNNTEASLQIQKTSSQNGKFIM